jgi:hypothetical protein
VRESGLSLKRVLAGVGALGLMSGVSVALALPTSAGAPPDELLESEISAEVFAPGETVTISSVDPCPADSSGPHYWVLQSLDDPDAGGEGPNVPTDDEGHWTVEFAAPPSDETGPDWPLGDYVFEMDCGLPHACDIDDVAAKTETTEPEVDCTEYYYQEFFTVEDEGPPTTPPTTAPPVTTPPAATPVIDDPPFTG